MTDVTQAASQEPAATDLDSLLDNAIEQHTPKDDTPAAEPAVEASPEPVIDDAGRLRGPDGKFVAKSDSAVPVASTPEPTAGAAKPADTPAPEPAPQPLDAPARWSADKKAQFATWPREVQETVLERIRDQEADYTRKTQEAAELRKSAEPYLKAVEPYQLYLNELAPRIGRTPDQMIANLLGVEYQLRTADPYTKAQTFYQIAAEYGIDLAALSRGEMPAAPAPADIQLRQSFGRLEQEVAYIRQEREREQQQRTVQEIEAFRTAADQSGRPLYPHFERVRGVMGQLLTDDPSLTLKAAYDKAIEPINQAIADSLKAQRETAEQERLASVERAKKAAPVRVSGAVPNGSSKSRDLDSLLSESIDRHFS